MKKGRYALYWDYLKRYSLAHKTLFSFMFLSLIFATVLQIPVPLLYKKIIDDILPKKQVMLLFKFGLLVLGIVFLREFFNYLSRIYARKLKNKMYFTLTKELFEGFFHIPYRKIKTSNAGYFDSRIFEEPKNLEQALTESVVFTLKLVLIFIFGLVVCFHLSWRLTLAIFIFVPFYYLMNGLSSPYIRKIAVKREEIKARLREYAIGSLNAYKIVLAIRDGMRIINNSIQRHLNQFLGIRYKYDKASSLYNGLYEILSDGMPIVIFFFGIYEIIHGRLTIGGLVAFTELMQYVNMPLQHFSDIIIEIETTVGIITRIEEFKGMMKKDRGQKSIDNVESIELENIGINFDGKKIIDNLSFTFQKGKGYIIKGDNGAGKSTLLDTILGFYLPDKGKIVINKQVDIKDIDKEHYRRRLSIAFFPPILLPLNKENIELVKDEELLKIAKEIIKGKEDKMFSELSAGEKQKLNILVSLSKDADFYLFDEPFSNMDKNAVLTFKDLILKRTIKRGKGLVMILHQDYNMADYNFDTLYLEKITQEV